MRRVFPGLFVYINVNAVVAQRVVNAIGFAQRRLRITPSPKAATAPDARLLGLDEAHVVVESDAFRRAVLRRYAAARIATSGLKSSSYNTTPLHCLAAPVPYS